MTPDEAVVAVLTAFDKAGIAYMVVTKLRWALGAQRSKDRDDIRNMLAVQGPALDWEYVKRWSTAHGTTRLLEEIQASIER